MSLSIESIVRRWGRWAAPATVLGLLGCASAPPAVPDAQPPASVAAVVAWQAPLPPAAVAPPSQAADLAAWWRVFGDEGLSQIIERALQAHTSVRAAQAALAQARAQRDLTAAATLPGLRAAASAQRGATAQTTSSSFRAGLDASWEVDVFGARGHALEASEADARASAAQLGQARVTLAAEVALTYLEWRAQQHRLQVARDNLAAQEAALQLTEWRAQAGLASQLDRDQARAAVAQTRSSVAPLEAAVAQSRQALAVLAGLPPQADLALPPEGAVPVAADTLAVAIPADTLRQRPDVQAAEARLQAAVARVGQTRAAGWPSLSVGGSLDWRSPRLSDLFDPASLSRALLASVSASVFDGGANRAQVRAQQAAAEQARIALEAAWLQALQEVESALLSLQASRQRLTHLQQAAEAAASAEALARHRYASGLIDYRALLDAQRTRLSAESERVTALAAWSADHVRLYKALGGGWRLDTLTTDLETIAHDPR